MVLIKDNQTNNKKIKIFILFCYSYYGRPCFLSHEKNRFKPPVNPLTFIQQTDPFFIIIIIDFLVSSQPEEPH